ncbi:hypothetical protein [Morganella morganii]|uniref:hypothetical protein n=1 Tax=Morganella morganii TaxID=582 RepID=UPI00339C0BEA
MDINEQIKKICNDILNIDIWSNFDESFFWPLISLLDVNKNNIIHIYDSSSDQQLDVLLHDKVINPLIESTQSNNLVNYLVTFRKTNRSKIDDFLIHDARSNLFSNYSEESSPSFVNNFNSIYMTLKDNVFYMMEHSSSVEDQESNLSFIKQYMDVHRHEFFSYVHAYWLGLYINNFVDDKLKNTYRDSLRCFFPRAHF